MSPSQMRSGALPSSTPTTAVAPRTSPCSGCRNLEEMTMKPPETHLDLLDRPLFAHFATVAADGSPRVNVMWFLWDADAGVVKMTHTNQRHNFRYLQQNPHVALSIADPDNAYRYLQLRGQVET